MLVVTRLPNYNHINKGCPAIKSGNKNASQIHVCKVVLRNILDRVEASEL